jgi:hypothetical protein
MAVFTYFVAIYQVVRCVDFPSRCSLSAGRAVSLLGVNACGVSPVPLHPQEIRTPAPINLKKFRIKNNNLYAKSQNKK